MHLIDSTREWDSGVFHALLTIGVAVGAPVMGWAAQFLGVELGLALSATVAALALVVAQIDLGKGP